MSPEYRVLHIITGLSTGGAERALYNLLSIGGIGQPVVISLRDGGTYGPRLRDLGIPVHELRLGTGLPGPRVLAQLRRIMREVEPHLVQGWMYHGNLAASLAARITPHRRPAVAWNIRQTLYSLTAEKMLTRQVIRGNRLVSKGPDAILYNSKLSRAQHEAFGFSAQRGQVIPNGFDIEQLSPDTERSKQMRQALGIAENVRVIGHVARFHPMKDHPSFLHAAVEVMRRSSDVVCLLAGRDVNLENPALAGIVPREFERRFYFVGERSDVTDLMRVMDILCLSSAWGEAFPNVLGEAMSLGVPCVATDVGDSRDIVGDTGLVVPPSNARALAECLVSMLERTLTERMALGRSARQRVQERYALPRIVEQYQLLYERLIRA